MAHCTKTLLLLSCLWSATTLAEPAFGLAQLESMAITSSQSILASRDQVSAARSAVETAGAFPNPEIEYLSGQVKARGPGGNPGNAKSTAITQPLDMPWRRTPRIAVAEAGLEATQAGARAFEAETLARLRLRYFEMLKREAELKNAQEDRKLMEKIRERIALRVDIGEAPKFELIKADAEALNAQKSAQAAAFRFEQSRSMLRQIVGPGLPVQFTLSGQLRDVPGLQSLDSLKSNLQTNSPDLARSRAEMVRAQKQLELERAQRLPTLAIKASVDNDPDMRASKIGLVLSIPLWDRRQGPVGEAAAQLSRARHELEAQQFSLSQTLEVAYQQYEIAQTQVTALESGIVRQAESALNIAEAAYRFGERGFLEVLDAQRVYRAARAELINARYELAAAWVDIERLRAAPGGNTQ